MVSLKIEGPENLERRVGGVCHPLELGGERIIIEGSTKDEVARQVLRAIRKTYSFIEHIDIKRRNAAITKYDKNIKREAESIQEMLFTYYFPRIPPKLFVKCTLPEEKMIVTLRDELYGGEWWRIEKDLEDRKKGRPYIFKLVNRIASDINRVKMLRTYEKTHRINLRKYYQLKN
jgi:hypothetical protein